MQRFIEAATLAAAKADVFKAIVLEITPAGVTILGKAGIHRRGNVRMYELTEYVPWIDIADGHANPLTQGVEFVSDRLDEMKSDEERRYNQLVELVVARLTVRWALDEKPTIVFGDDRNLPCGLTKTGTEVVDGTYLLQVRTTPEDVAAARATVNGTDPKVRMAENRMSEYPTVQLCGHLRILEISQQEQ